MVKKSNYTEPLVRHTNGVEYYYSIGDRILETINKLKNLFKKKEKSSFIKHAERELTLLGYDINQKKEDPNKWMVECVCELLETFSKQGHSGFSAPECINLFTKLAKYDILTPLTGKDDEWNIVSASHDGKKLWQNKRCSHVFKDDRCKHAYDINGKVFTDKNSSYTNRKSRVYIKKFPYTPKTIYVKE